MPGMVSLGLGASHLISKPSFIRQTRSRVILTPLLPDSTHVLEQPEDI
jgi:hypothetical protein